MRVEVEAVYSEEHSDPLRGFFFFLYTITISNRGEETVQLLNRHWVITDGAGQVKEVRGPGVVGEQPVLEPGQAFEYTSGCPLETPTGSMRGEYEMTTPNGSRFLADVAAFELSRPHALH
ncbi:MAG: Co2+/Mg2+ efflux protein ApaG [Proteobacteria bacterium]|nr:Co2+/Mg2+ efflux protein ApaG [Pseudomonadota bacterium]